MQVAIILVATELLERRNAMLIRKGLNIPRERNSKKQKRSEEKGTSYKDYEGHPYVGYMDGDVFVPNSKTVEAFNERSRMLSEYRSELGK